MKILSGTSNLKLSKDISKKLKLKLVNTNIRRFADGEIYIEINENTEKKFKKHNSKNKIFVSIGPCIGKKSYEVDIDFYRKFI